MWKVMSGGKLMYNYSYPSADYKWSIAYLKWWIGDLYLSSLFHHHQMHPSGNYSFSWQPETVIFHGHQNFHQSSGLLVPISDHWSIRKSLCRRRSFCCFLNKDFWTCLGWCIYVHFLSESCFIWERWTTAAYAFRETRFSFVITENNKTKSITARNTRNQSPYARLDLPQLP